MNSSLGTHVAYLQVFRVLLVMVLLTVFLVFFSQSVVRYNKGRVATEQRTEDQKTFLFPSIAMCAQQHEPNNSSHKTLVTWALQRVAVNETRSDFVFVGPGAAARSDLGLGENAIRSMWDFFHLGAKGGGTMYCDRFHPALETRFGWENVLSFGIRSRDIPEDTKYLLVAFGDKEVMNWAGGDKFGSKMVIVPVHHSSPGDKHLKTPTASLVFGQRKRLSSQERPCLDKEEEERRGKSFSSCVDEYVTGVTGCEILDSGCWKKLPRDKEGKEGNKLYLDLFEQLNVLGEKEIISMTGCVPPCLVSDHEISLTGVFETPNTERMIESETDMVFSVYNPTPMKTVKFDYLVYDGYALFADAGGLVGVLLGLSCLALFDHAAAAAERAAALFLARRKGDGSRPKSKAKMNNVK